MRAEIVLTEDEVRENIPYEIICVTKESSIWNTMRRKRMWKEEFTDAERSAATDIFRKAHSWTLVKGVPDETRMSMKTYKLWQKLGCFCGSL